MAKSSTGLEENIAGLLCYVLWWISGIVFLVLEKENKFVKFHAIQSIIVFGTITIGYIILGILGLIPGLFWFSFVLNRLLGLLAFVLMIVLIIKAYMGQKYKLPWAGNFAEKHA